MLMAWGPFRFTVPAYSVERISRSIAPRLAEQAVIGAAPPIHRLGPGNEEITLSSTFHPHHLNGRGLAQLAGVRQMVNSVTPQMLVHINGAALNIFGMWIATGMNDEQEGFAPGGTPGSVTTTLTLKRYGDSGGRGIAIEAAVSMIAAGSMRLGF